jgi:hypothetical protein
MRRFSAVTMGTLVAAGLVLGTAGMAGAAHAPKSTAPTVKSVSPDVGPVGGGTIVTIKGKNVVTATAVDFGTAPATTFTPKGNNSLVATAPAEEAGAVAVTVTNPSGTSTSVLSAADQFTYTTGPTIQSVSPRVGGTTGGTKVTIAGSGFTGVTAVDFGSTPATYTFDSDQAISAIAPPSSGNAPGPVNVSVTVGSATTPTEQADVFTYALRIPVVSQVNPTGGPAGTQVTISGSFFAKKGTTVDFGAGNPATTIDVVNSKTIIATAPDGSGTVDVTVTDSKGTSNSTVTFAYSS